MEKPFVSVDEAKEFLIAKVIAQAQRDNVPLSDAERKMMYYSVEKSTVADEVADQFPDEDPGYEEKISLVFRHAFQYDKAEQVDYINALRELKKEDHYLEILVGSALNPTSLRVQDRNPLDLLRLFLSALGVIVVLLILTVYWQSWKESFWHWFDLHFNK